jgi:esterase/lipase
MRDIFKVHILAVEYPGYGTCAGSCNEAGIMANAHTALRFATETLSWPYDSIKLFGRSLGTGPAMRLAAEYPDIAGLILVTPFLSFREVVRHQAGVFASLFDDCFLNQELVERIDSPTLIIHGTQDTLVPISHGMWIYEHLYSQKMMVCPENWHHNSSLLDNARMFVQPMVQFFSLPDFAFIDIELPAWVFPEYAQTDVEQVMPEFPCSGIPERFPTLLTGRGHKSSPKIAHVDVETSKAHPSGSLALPMTARTRAASLAIPAICPNDPSPDADCTPSPTLLCDQEQLCPCE